MNSIYSLICFWQPYDMGWADTFYRWIIGCWEVKSLLKATQQVCGSLWTRLTLFTFCENVCHIPQPLKQYLVFQFFFQIKKVFCEKIGLQLIQWQKRFSYFGMQQKRFICTSHFITQTLIKMHSRVEIQ